MFNIDKEKYRNNSKGLIFYKSYRIANWSRKGKIRNILLSPVWISYRLIFNWILGIDINENTKIGKNLMVWHGIGLIVHPASIIGNNVTLRHNTTIGISSNDGKAPTIEDNVEIGAGSIILGDIIIEKNVIIGAGSVVTKSIPENAIVVGNPAKIIRYKV